MTGIGSELLDELLDELLSMRRGIFPVWVCLVFPYLLE